MKDKLKAIATANSWGFTYGRSDFYNLYDGVPDGSVLMFLDPLSSSDILGERGNTEAISWSGKFLLSMSSNIDEIDYEERYTKYIGPITAGAFKAFKAALRCERDYVIKSITSTEVINSGDFNVDGLAVSFIIEQQINE